MKGRACTRSALHRIYCLRQYVAGYPPSSLAIVAARENRAKPPCTMHECTPSAT